MNKLRGNHWTKPVLVFAINVIVVLAILITLTGFVEVNNALHPPRIIPPGNTLRKYKIEYQSIDLITDDGIRLSAWYTPPKNGAVILLAHGYGRTRGLP